MKDELELHIPAYQELWYRQRLMEDPETMSYNRGYDLDFEGYDRETGCIAFPREQWADWYAYFVGQEPARYAAYIVRTADGALIGEANLHRCDGESGYGMGIVIEAKYRGQGYAREALELLLEHAFEEMGAEAVHNDFERTRTAALRAHMAAGFALCREEKGIVHLILPRERYFQRKAMRRAD